MTNQVRKSSVILWAHPRSRSTAIFRMAVERGDYDCIHEPFCTITDHKNYSFTVNGERYSANDIESLLLLLKDVGSKRPVFIKETTDYRYQELYDNIEMLRNFQHIFLVRDLATTVESHYEMNPNMKKEEIGYTHLLDLYHLISNAFGKMSYVIDSDKLVINPEFHIKKLCNWLNIPFMPSSLQWQAEDLPHWEKTQRWHGDTAHSTGFFQSKIFTFDEIKSNTLMKECFLYQKKSYDEFMSLAQ